MYIYIYICCICVYIYNVQNYEKCHSSKITEEGCRAGASAESTLPAAGEELGCRADLIGSEFPTMVAFVSYKNSQCLMVVHFLPNKNAPENN